MKGFLISMIAYLAFSIPQKANTYSPARCDYLISGGVGIVVTKVEDKAHLNDPAYLIFYGDRECSNTAFVVKRDNFNETTLREIKRSILISYAAKRKILFTPTTADFTTTVDVDLTKSISLK